MKSKQNLNDIISGKDYAKKNDHKKGLISNLDSLITSANQSQEYIKINLSIQKLNSIIFNLLIIFSISFFCFSLIFTVSFVSKTLEIKNKVIGYGSESIEYFKNGFTKLLEFNTSESEKLFNKSIETSDRALKELSPIKPLTASLSLLPGIKDYASNASISFEAIKDISNLGREFSKIENIVELEKNNKSLDYGQKIESSFTNIRDSLSRFEKNIYSLDGTTLPLEYRQRMDALKTIYPEFKRYLKETETILKELPEIAGFYESKNYLILLENNNELRGAGGFIGSFGILSLEKNSIKDFYIRDTYLLDRFYGQAISEGKETYFAPPFPMDPVGTGNWALRDSNINPDFAISAKYAEDFYLKEIKYAEDKSYPTKIDGVIAITPTFFEDILKITGPILIEEYNLTVSSDNLLETLQLEVEQGQDKQNNKNPKTILDVLKQKVIDQLSTFNDEQKTLLLSTIVNNLDQKQILINTKNNSVSRILNDFKWDGRTKDIGNYEDYLMVVNNNFGGGKSSLKVDEEITQNITIDNNGKIVKTLKIRRTHTSDYKHLYYDPWSKREMWLIGDNNNYTKVYLPKGSKLISSEGIEQEIFVGEENKKTFFGFGFSVKPREEKEITLTYELPFTIKEGKLVYTIEKQPGALPDKIVTTVENLSTYNITTDQKSFLDSYQYLETDMKIILDIKK